MGFASTSGELFSGDPFTHNCGCNGNAEPGGVSFSVARPIVFWYLRRLRPNRSDSGEPCALKSELSERVLQGFSYRYCCSALGLNPSSWKCMPASTLKKESAPACLNKAPLT